MKTVLIAATFAVLSVTFSAPVQAASTAPLVGSLEQMLSGSFDHRGRRCDTAHDIAEHPRCTKA